MYNEFMNVGIYSNRNYLERDNANIQHIKDRLIKAGNSCTIVENNADIDGGIDVLFVLGGDGTILNVAAECALCGVKIIGINYGHIGFLTEFEADRIDEAVSLVIDGNYKIKKRNLLEIDHLEKFFAINDVVIQRNTGAANFSNTVGIHAEIDGTTVDNFSADGIIVSTPTGSTAYSLSAGGSVLSPDLHAFSLTPICAHSLHSRPIVFSDESTVTISPVSCRESLVIIVDGKVVGKLPVGEKVTIKNSHLFAQFITRGEEDFFKKLLIKLSIWSK